MHPDKPEDEPPVVSDASHNFIAPKEHKGMEEFPRLDRNNLANATSPYLLQHSTNPVWWQPWSNEVLEIAQGLGHPLFISIGYSTCHWCHVMEEESFANPSTAELLNSYFIPIKIDREERPDLDSYYMNIAQMMGVSGGWPLNIFADSTGVPFWIFTYAPPENKHGLNSFSQLIHHFAEQWKNSKEKIIHRGANNAVLLKEYFMNRSASSLEQESELVVEEKASPLNDYFMKQVEFFEVHEKYFDKNMGGFKFQARVKFPHLLNLAHLLRLAHFWLKPSLLICSSNTSEVTKKTNIATIIPPSSEKLKQITRSLKMVIKSVLAMLRGGLYDQVGGGLFRYSTDYSFHIPHFEKMLYDNALFLELLSDCYQVFSEIRESLLKSLYSKTNKPLEDDSTTTGLIAYELLETLSPYYSIGKSSEFSDSSKLLKLINSFLQEVIRETRRTASYYDEEMSASLSPLSEIVNGSDYFFAAQDAGDKHGEGAYYAWGKRELEDTLLQLKQSKNTVDFFTHFSLHPFINAHANDERNNTTMVESMPVQTFHLKRKPLLVPEVQDTIDIILKKLLMLRQTGRSEFAMPPFKDYKLIISWNAMMIAGYLKAYKVTHDQALLTKASTVLEHIFTRCRIELSTLAKFSTIQDAHHIPKHIDRILLHSFVDNGVPVNGKYIHGFLNDYIELARSCFLMYRITGKTLYHDRTLTLVEEALYWFYHEHESKSNNGNTVDEVGINISCSETSILHNGLVPIMEEPYDGIEHSSPALLATLLLELSALHSPVNSDNSVSHRDNKVNNLNRYQYYYEVAEKILTKFYPLIGSTSMSTMSEALFYYQTGIKTISYYSEVMNTDKPNSSKSKFHTYLCSRYFSDWIILHKPFNTKSIKSIGDNEKPIKEYVVVCDEKHCSAPLMTTAELDNYLLQHYQKNHI